MTEKKKHALLKINNDLDRIFNHYKTIELKNKVLRNNLPFGQRSPIFSNHKTIFLNENVKTQQTKSNIHFINKSISRIVDNSMERSFDRINNNQLDQRRTKANDNSIENFLTKSKGNNNSIYSESVSQIYGWKSKMRKEPDCPKIKEFITLQSLNNSDKLPNFTKRLYLRDLISKRFNIARSKSNPYKIFVRSPLKHKKETKHQKSFINLKYPLKEIPLINLKN